MAQLVARQTEDLKVASSILAETILYNSYDKTHLLHETTISRVFISYMLNALCNYMSFYSAVGSASD